MPTRRAMLAGAGASLGLLAAGPARALLRPTEYELALPDMAAIADDLWIARLTDRSWIISFTHVMSPGVVFPANGLVALTPAGPVLVDPGWSAPQADALIRFVTARFGRPIGALATHYHEDRVAGLATARRFGIPTYVTPRTAALLAKAPLPAPAPDPVPIFGLETWWPGAGHSPDNIVVWSASDRVLFGGCLLKSASATDLGYIDNADLPSWRTALDRLDARYPADALVIPGHGGLGGNPIAHTRALLATVSSPQRSPRRTSRA